MPTLEAKSKDLHPKAAAILELAGEVCEKSDLDQERLKMAEDLLELLCSPRVIERVLAMDRLGRSSLDLDLGGGVRDDKPNMELSEDLIWRVSREHDGSMIGGLYGSLFFYSGMSGIEWFSSENELRTFLRGWSGDGYSEDEINYDKKGLISWNATIQRQYTNAELLLRSHGSKLEEIYEKLEELLELQEKSEEEAKEDD